MRCSFCMIQILVPVKSVLLSNLPIASKEIFRDDWGLSVQNPRPEQVNSTVKIWVRLFIIEVDVVGFGGGSRRVFRDPFLILPDLNGPRSLYVVLFDKENPEIVLTCGQFREQQPRKSQALFGHKGVRGEILFEQRSHFDPTRVLVNLTGNQVGLLKVVFNCIFVITIYLID